MKWVESVVSLPATCSRASLWIPVGHSERFIKTMDNHTVRIIPPRRKGIYKEEGMVVVESKHRRQRGQDCGETGGGGRGVPVPGGVYFYYWG